ncbi:lysoplasmalogenase [Nocardioides sp. TRM66260-LWL]|uniref:lysoplasmalogenase family protein n=1 Tax=Nocardioides sp. TRM66260-LWL TaxID=2874478 RepID=UPI001CC36CD7|nr:lysoplasmalogenase family protein [Nocardioides sp. TRM66260-LWL]MBZ5735832.1 lysoplasmalogenase [Nocardioides sp. TRM66260-LWL]
MRATKAVYGVVAVATAVAGAREHRPSLVPTKGALMPLLASAVTTGRDRGLLRTALAAAWAGDLALLPPRAPEDDAAARRRLRRGAAAFAVQQAAYLTLLARRGHRPRPAVAAAVGAWLGTLAVLDVRAGGGRPDPVVTGYGLLLGTMAATALGSNDGELRTGGGMFLASDSAILLRELLLSDHRTRALAEAFVLLTYADAQWHLVQGLARD